MNEKKRLYVMFGVVVGILVVVSAICIAGNQSIKELFKSIDEKMQSNTVQVFYFEKPTCHYCMLLKPVTDTLKEEYELSYNYIDTSTLNNGQLKRILDKFGITYKTFGTPHLTITKNGKVLDHLSGYADENIVFELFQTTGVIPKEATLTFEYIDYDTFKKLFKKEQKTLIMIGQSGEDSVNARNQLKTYIRENGIQIYYMDIAETGNSDNYSELLQLIDHSEQTDYPILMIVENGKIISEITQTASYEQFLRTNGYIG